VSSSPTRPPETPTPGAEDPSRPAAGRPWSPWAEVGREWRLLVGLVGGLGVAGVALGVLWWLLAPRADYRITTAGPVPIGNPSEELLIADDSIFVLIVAVLGLAAGIATWLIRRRRGLAGLLGVSLGTLAAAAVAWQVGEMLGHGPTRVALTHVGGQVTTRLTLGSVPALAVGPFFAVLVWVGGTLYARADDLGRNPPPLPSHGAPAVAPPPMPHPQDAVS
jgi:hypothetical protein